MNERHEFRELRRLEKELSSETLDQLRPYLLFQSLQLMLIKILERPA